MENPFQKSKLEVYNIFNRIKKRDFSGVSGLAIKNSIYRFLTNSSSKIGSFLFTVIIARLLMPELFGLYSLVLGTIILFSRFGNFGEGKAVLKFVSASLGKNNKPKAKAYTIYLIKIKLIILAIVVLALLLLSNFLAETYYNKPIFLALLAGILYIIFSSFSAIFETILQALNNFRTGFFKEVFFQVLRLAFIPFIVLILLKHSASYEFLLFIMILALSALYLASLIFIRLFSKKDLEFLKSKKINLTKKQKKTLNYFLIAISTTIFSGIFLGYIDLVMLGHFVLAEFLGYYQAALNIVGTLVPLISFSVVFFPIFSRLRGKRLEKGFNRIIKMTLLISIVFFIITLSFSFIIVNIIYGSEYLLSVNLLRILSVLIISIPLSLIYENYLLSQNRAKIVAILLISTTVLNVILNYVLIVWLIDYSQLAAVFGVTVATVFIRFFYLFGVIIAKKKTTQKYLRSS